MNWLLIRIATQVVATGCSVILAVWATMPVMAVGLALFGAATIAAGLKFQQEKPMTKWGRSLGWVSAILSAGMLFFLLVRSDALDVVHAAIPWLGALSSLLVACRRGTVAKDRWLVLSFVWAFVCSLLLLSISYLHNHWLPFHVGLLALLILAVLVKRCFSLPVWSIQVLNTVILLTIGLPVGDRLLGGGSRVGEDVELEKKPYSYNGLGRNSDAFRNWWMYYMRQMNALHEDVLMTDPAGVLPFVLRPHSTGKLFGAEIHINSKGFRGREIEENGAYRIVTMGESTTFGLNLGNAPWSELLERKIKEEIAGERGIQVINTGVPAYTLKHNVSRLESEIFPLKPDMIVSYHGINGFGFLSDGLPPIVGGPPPPYMNRPLRLLADCEYGLKMRSYKESMGFMPKEKQASTSDVMNSEYARLYRQLIAFAETNEIQLVLANFSLAVNGKSPSDLIEFYRPGYPSVHRQIKLNEIHSELIKQLVEVNPGVIFVDTQPELDGHHEKFIDLMHFTAEGEEQMTKAFFATIRPVLEQQLSTNTVVGLHE